MHDVPIVTGNMAFITGFMQNRTFTGYIAGNEDVQITDLHGVAVVFGNPIVIKFNAKLARSGS